jgi:hypothetical protein
MGSFSEIRSLSSSGPIAEVSVDPVSQHYATSEAAETIRNDDSQQKAPIAFHATRLTERMAGPEMHFTWHAQGGEGIQVSATMRGRNVQLVVNTERLEVASAVRDEVPTLDASLQQHALRLGEVKVISGEGTLSTQLSMSGQQHREHEWAHFHQPLQPERERTEVPSDVVLANQEIDERLSVLA